MAEDAPTIYLLHGDDELAISEALSSILNKFKDPATAELNTTRLDGQSSSLDELAEAVSAFPFLAPRRLVIYKHPVSRLQTSGLHKRFVEILESIPQTTALVLIEYSPLINAKGRWIKETQWIGKWFENTGQRTYMRAFSLPRSGALVHWIIEHAASMAGSITPQAASMLADLTGNNTQLLHVEIVKLLDYVNYKRPVEVEDIQLLTPDAAQVDDFALVNALRERDSKQAQAVLQRKLEVEEPGKILGSMIYQFRLLLLAREIIDDGGSKEAVTKQLAQLEIKPYPAELAYKNAFRFSPEALQDIYRYLLEIDESIKTGKIDALLALELFTVQVTS